MVDFPPTPHILIKIASIKKIESDSDHKDQEIGSVVTQVEKSRIFITDGEDRADSPITQSRKQ